MSNASVYENYKIPGNIQDSTKHKHPCGDQQKPARHNHYSISGKPGTASNIKNTTNQTTSSTPTSLDKRVTKTIKPESPPESPVKLLTKAIINGDANTVKKLIKHKQVSFNNLITNPHDPEGEEITPLMLACFHGRDDIVKLLIDKIKVHVPTETEENEFTALDFAMCITDPKELDSKTTNRKEIVMSLIKKAPQLLQKKDKKGNTPLHVAYAAGYTSDKSLITKLCNKGAISNSKNQDNKEPEDIRAGILECNAQLKKIVAVNQHRAIISENNKAASQICQDIGIKLNFCENENIPSPSEDTEALINKAKEILKELDGYRIIKGSRLFGFHNDFNIDNLYPDAASEKTTSVNNIETLSDISDGSGNLSVCLSSYDYDVANLDDFSDNFSDNEDEKSIINRLSISQGKFINEKQANEVNNRIETTVNRRSMPIEYIEKLTKYFLDALNNGWHFNDAYPVLKASLSDVDNLVAAGVTNPDPIAIMNARMSKVSEDSNASLS